MEPEALRYCPRCGHQLAEPVLLRGPEHLRCHRCGFILWRNPQPVAAAFIVRRTGETCEILLGRRTVDPGRGRWHVPGGFLHVGETPEQAVVRECEEELGLRVRPVRYLGGFPDWYGHQPILVLTYQAEVEGGKLAPADDLADPCWHALDRIPPLAFPSCEAALEVLRALMQTS